MALMMRDVTPTHLRHSQVWLALYDGDTLAYTLTRVYDNETGIEPWVLKEVVDGNIGETVEVCQIHDVASAEPVEVEDWALAFAGADQ